MQFSGEGEGGIRMPEPPEWLMARSEKVSAARGEALIEPLEPIEHIYIVLTGHIDILTMGPNGQENVVSTVGPGGVLGEMEVLSGQSLSTFSARARRDSTLIRMPAEGFLKWVREDIDACWQLVQVLTGKLYIASEQSSTNTHSRAWERMLLQLIRRADGRVNLTRQELAQLCSISVRSVNRCVRRLNQEGLVTLERGKIVISQAQIEAMKRRIIEKEDTYV